MTSSSGTSQGPIPIAVVFHTIVSEVVVSQMGAVCGQRNIGDAQRAVAIEVHAGR